MCPRTTRQEYVGTKETNLFADELERSVLLRRNEKFFLPGAASFLLSRKEKKTENSFEIFSTFLKAKSNCRSSSPCLPDGDDATRRWWWRFQKGYFACKSRCEFSNSRLAQTAGGLIQRQQFWYPSYRGNSYIASGEDVGGKQTKRRCNNKSKVLWRGRKDFAPVFCLLLIPIRMGEARFQRQRATDNTAACLVKPESNSMFISSSLLSCHAFGDTARNGSSLDSLQAAVWEGEKQKPLKGLGRFGNYTAFVSHDLS